jgi:hypothetical protein
LLDFGAGSVYIPMAHLDGHCAALPDIDTRSPDEIIGYDENGSWS